QAITEPQAWRTLPGPIEDQQLLFDEHGFGHDSTRAAGSGKPNDRHQRMQKKDGQLTHAEDRSKILRPSKTFQNYYFRHTHEMASDGEDRVKQMPSGFDHEGRSYAAGGLPTVSTNQLTTGRSARTE